MQINHDIGIKFSSLICDAHMPQTVLRKTQFTALKDYLLTVDSPRIGIKMRTDSPAHLRKIAVQRIEK